MISYKISTVGATENLTLYYANKQQYISATPEGFNMGGEYPTGGGVQIAHAWQSE